MFIRRIDIPRTDKEYGCRIDMLSCGGIGLMKFIDNADCGASINFLPSVCQNIGLTNTSYFMFVMEEIKDYLNDAELEAALLHEEGHYVLGHLKTITTSGIVDNQDFEYEADDYAADHVGPAILISALSKLFDFMIDVALPEMISAMPFDEAMLNGAKETMSVELDAVIKSRIDRLNARLAH